VAEVDERLSVPCRACARCNLLFIVMYGLGTGPATLLGVDMANGELKENVTLPATVAAPLSIAYVK
jgi:hypothetical protein